ncbi:MAG: zinc-binding dehydrogenase, partial [Candidatus Thorarchaeota archaeon]
YDVIFDVIGKASYSGCIKSLKDNGIFLISNPKGTRKLRGRWTSRRSSKKVIVGATADSTEDLIFLKELAEAENLKAVIDRRFPLEQTAEAHRYVDAGEKIGNVIITVE